ncbi:MAG: T9SS type A sorting domain-containing protein [Calditrichota bacterium]
MTYPLLTLGSSVAQAYGVDRQSLVIDGAGIIRWIGATHSLPIAQIQDTIETYLARLSNDDLPHDALPGDFGISAVYPNPFNATVRIEMVLPNLNRNARLEVFDVSGRQVAEFPISSNSAERQTILWSPQGIASGRYFLSLIHDYGQQTVPLIFLK